MKFTQIPVIDWAHKFCVIFTQKFLFTLWVYSLVKQLSLTRNKRILIVLCPKPHKYLCDFNFKFKHKKTKPNICVIEAQHFMFYVFFTVPTLSRELTFRRYLKVTWCVWTKNVLGQRSADVLTAVPVRPEAAELHWLTFHVIPRH